ncbi:MAG: TolC family protein [Polyangiaceae bacterium]|nr:TolC family protein [Polyangiaceae bacterium]
MHRSSFAFAGALGLLAACAGGPPGARGGAAAESPSPHLRGAVEGGAPRAARAPSPRLPEPAAGSDVSLGGLLDYADRHSPVLAVARSTRSRAEAERIAASVAPVGNPDLSVAAGPRFGGAGTGVDFELSLTQELELGGARGRRVAAADAGAELTDAEIEAVRWAVHCDVHAAFHRALVEREHLKLAERMVQFQAEVLSVVERQIAAGEAAPLALRLARAELAQAKQEHVTAAQASLSARIRLAQLSGWPVEAPPTPIGVVDLPRDPPPLERLLAVARERLPSLRERALRVREAEARAEAADREAWPRPALGVQYRHEGSAESAEVRDIVLGVVSLPLPGFQRNQGERARARAELRVREAERAAAQRLLAGEIAQARSEVVAAAARTRAYGDEIIPGFEENLTLLRRSFELGEIDLLALSTARERFLRIQSDALAAHDDYFVALAGLERVVGVDLWRDDHDEEAAR